MERIYIKELEKVGKKIKKMRTELKMTQKELAGKAEIDERTVQKIEKGDYNPTLNILFAIADALDMEFSDLVKI